MAMVRGMFLLLLLTLAVFSCNSVQLLQSSLLSAIMDQMPILSGQITKTGTLAYVPQEAWVFSGTVRENILFGKALDRNWYGDVIRMCELVEVSISDQRYSNSKCIPIGRWYMVQSVTPVAFLP